MTAAAPLSVEARLAAALPGLSAVRTELLKSDPSLNQSLISSGTSTFRAEAGRPRDELASRADAEPKLKREWLDARED